MTRVPLDIAAKIGECSQDTIRAWVRRGHINRYDDGYEITEILHWIDQRDTRMIDLANGKHPRHAEPRTLDAL